MQKAVLVKAGYKYGNKKEEVVWEDNIKELDDLLNEGWKVKETSGMGTFGYGFAAGYSYAGSQTLVILEK
jgi:hypothetical protein